MNIMDILHTLCENHHRACSVPAQGVVKTYSRQALKRMEHSEASTLDPMDADAAVVGNVERNKKKGIDGKGGNNTAEDNNDTGDAKDAGHHGRTAFNQLIKDDIMAHLEKQAEKKKKRVV